jgi:hypothetical protein
MSLSQRRENRTVPVTERLVCLLEAYLIVVKGANTQRIPKLFHLDICGKQ